MSLIVDGMDQSKLMLPHLINMSKAYSGAFKLRTHLTGVLGHGTNPLFLLDLFQWPHDSNLTMNALWHALLRRERIPDICFLQMDNCYRENKNQYVFLFLALLIKAEIFRKVRSRVGTEFN